ncbi:MAG: serine/threonine-protein kinase [Inhella sp.]|uniref:serine/threonine-protein kinase n=1 Tax=Inhella sp. TaxID=1921806 RepID=UPI00391FC10B
MATEPTATSTRSDGASSSGFEPSTSLPEAELPPYIGKYKVTRRLGEGATSDVFLAHDPVSGQDVAIKRVRTWRDTSRSANGAANMRDHFFAAEASLAGRLLHPNVVHILDAVFDEEAPYLVMEFVPGVTMRHFCRADRLLPLDQIVELGFKVGMALDYCFRRGIVHRDVKPANLLAVLDEYGRVVDIKLSDFGSALHLDSERTQVHRVGSLAYMPPEQLDGGDIDARADQYALAAVLYHLISGRAPFEAPSQIALMNQIYHQAPKPLTELREGVGMELDGVIQQALSKRPEDRFADWPEFTKALSDLVAKQLIPLARFTEVKDSERFNLLRALDFFRDFGDVELWEVVRRARWRRYPLGHLIFKRGHEGNSVHIIAVGKVEVVREGKVVATLGSGTSVGEMAYLAPNPEMRKHSTDIRVIDVCTTVSFTPALLGSLSGETQHRFDRAFIRVLVRRLHAAHEQLTHPRRIL